MNIRTYELIDLLVNIDEQQVNIYDIKQDKYVYEGEAYKVPESILKREICVFEIAQDRSIEISIL